MPPRRRRRFLRPVRDTGPPINEKIKAREVRVIGADGEQLGVYHTPDAVRLAQEAGYDLVEVASKSDPPVCRIMDYGKYKYEQKKKQGGKKQHASTMKEIKLRPKIEQHDFDFKVERIRRFLQEGHKVKVTLVFRGREMAHQELGKDVLRRALEVVKDDGTVEFLPKMEGRMFHAVLAPTKAARQKGAERAKKKAEAAAGNSGEHHKHKGKKSDEDSDEVQSAAAGQPAESPAS